MPFSISFFPCNLFASPCRPRFASPWHKAARFGKTEEKSYICISKKRKSAGFSSFRVLGANYPIRTEKLSYMSVKIISKPVKICSFIIFTKCFKVKISLIFADFFSEHIFVSLIIPKSPPRAALTIANALSTLCAGKEAALTCFVTFGHRPFDFNPHVRYCWLR